MQLALSLLEQVPALATGLCRDTRGLLPGNIAHMLSCLDTAVSQVRCLILDQLGRACSVSGHSPAGGGVIPVG